uniref:Uncharacterized protein n=1 Tax=Anguilla anguilla TaxID=7936 RepID=A0A0E9TJH3_ANGAN
MDSKMPICFWGLYPTDKPDHLKQGSRFIYCLYMLPK